MEPTNLDYIRAHQYLYYVTQQQILSDWDYDKFGRDTGEEYKGGSDNPKHYTPCQVELAHGITTRQKAPYPDSYSQ